MEARKDSTVFSLSNGVSARWLRICERSTPLESISGMGKGSPAGNSDMSIGSAFTQQSLTWEAIGKTLYKIRTEIRDSHAKAESQKTFSLPNIRGGFARQLFE